VRVIGVKMSKQEVLESELEVKTETKIVSVVPIAQRMSEEELQQKEKELLGGSFILPTLEDANVIFNLGEEEGPLDVLLELVKETKLDIMEVNLADLTEQFLKYMEKTSFNMEQKSEFVAIAATLLEIKSRTLLPIEPDENEEDEDDPENALKRQLQLYKIFKEAGGELALIENTDHFYKEPDKSAGDFRLVLKNMDMQGLIDAFSKLLVKIEKKELSQEEKQIRKDRFTLADSIINLRSSLSQNKRIKFKDCFATDYTRGEIIITFLAMLELLKTQYATAKQDEIFGDIEIILREEKEDGQTNIE